MKKEDLKKWTRDMLIDEMIRLDRENTDLQDSHINLYNITKDEIRNLKMENKALKQKLKSITDVCDDRCFADYEDLPFGDDEDEKDELIAELQDQHQQDCIRYNDMRTAYLVTLDELARLREQFGVGR